MCATTTVTALSMSRSTAPSSVTSLGYAWCPDNLYRSAMTTTGIVFVISHCRRILRLPFRFL
jgi:hypothetical protein